MLKIEAIVCLFVNRAFPFYWESDDGHLEALIANLRFRCVEVWLAGNLGLKSSYIGTQIAMLSGLCVLWRFMTVSVCVNGKAVPCLALTKERRRREKGRDITSYTPIQQ